MLTYYAYQHAGRLRDIIGLDDDGPGIIDPRRKKKKKRNKHFLGDSNVNRTDSTSVKSEPLWLGKLKYMIMADEVKSERVRESRTHSRATKMKGKIDPKKQPYLILDSQSPTDELLDHFGDEFSSKNNFLFICFFWGWGQFVFFSEPPSLKHFWHTA